MNEALQQRPIDQVGAPPQHPLNVGEMLLCSAVPVVLELPDDHVFGRSDPDRPAANGLPPSVVQAPAVDGIVACQVDVRSQSRLMVQQVEMPVTGPGRFRPDRLGGGHVKLPDRECRDETRGVRGGKLEHQVEVESQAGFAIHDGGDGPGGHVGDRKLVERLGEAAEEVNQRHG